MEIHERYFQELGKLKHYEMKCNMYIEIDQEKYHRYLPKYLHHKNMASKYYHMTKEKASFLALPDDESVFADSKYFDDQSYDQ